MKKLTKKIIFIPASIIILFIGFILILDSVIMPWYVDAPELTVPDLVGKHKDEAIAILKGLKLNPVEEGPRYNNKFPKDHVIYQRPRAGSTVKENRRIYLFISGGESLVKMPQLEGKTLRDAEITLERIGLALGEIKEVRSEIEAGRVVEQSIPEGENLPKGELINLNVSVGPERGKTLVPSILGQSLKNGIKILNDNSLKVGKINYIVSENLLDNTIYQQYPSPNSLLAIGDSVDVWIIKSSPN